MRICSRAKRHWRYSLIAFGSLGLAQCSLIIDDDRQQCSTDAECTERGGEFASSICENSACIPNPSWACAQYAADSEASTSGSSTVRLPLVGVLDQQPFAGVTAIVCNKIDTDCQTPIGNPVVTDADGVLEVVVPSGFDGYLSLTHQLIGPSLYFFNPPVLTDAALPPIRLASLETAQALVSLVGGQYDPTRALLVLTAEDCLGTPAEGVSYAASPAEADTFPFYSVGHLPTTDTTMTDESGYGGLLGVRPGSVTVTMANQVSGALGEFTVLAKAGTVTYARMVPSAVN